MFIVIESSAHGTREFPCATDADAVREYALIANMWEGDDRLDYIEIVGDDERRFRPTDNGGLSAIERYGLPLVEVPR